jgi:hypothetical protein
MTATKKSAKKKASRSARKKSAKSSTGNYTKPELRERVKQRIVAGDKGGRPGQWSARKAQLLTKEYEAEGGGYKKPRTAAQQSLKKWGDEKWHTSDGKKAVHKKKTKRYLPDAAWKELTPGQRAATNRKKVKGSKRGAQFVANTPAAAKARKNASTRRASASGLRTAAKAKPRSGS